MNLAVIVLGIFFSLFSTVILSYISVATMVGPWIAPTIVLIGHAIFAGFRSMKNKTQALIALQAIGAGGGIIATGVGFAFPMLYFLDPTIFNAWLAQPGYFCLVLTTLCLLAGSLGLLAGNLLTKPFIDDQKLPFPVSNLTYQVAAAENHPQQTTMLAGGAIGTILLRIMRDGISWFKPIIKDTYLPLLPTPSWLSNLMPTQLVTHLGKDLAFTVWPTLWAIGFSVGLGITIPLCIGMAAKYLVIWPLANHATYLPWHLFAVMNPETFAIAFCSGLVACELVLQLPGYALGLLRWARNFTLESFETPFGLLRTSERKATNNKLNSAQTRETARPEEQRHSVSEDGRLEGFERGWLAPLQAMLRTPQAKILALSLVLGITGFLSYFAFSPLAQLLLISFTLLATYSICQLGGKIGMIPFGRYSTFIVVPLLIIFKLDPIQTTIACVFFNICAAAASDLLFDMKSADLGGIKRKDMVTYQWIGLIATALSIGIVLWLLFTNLQLGSEALFAQRGKAKALLLQSLQFDAIIVLLGILFGVVLKRLKINGTMVFGGIIMPGSITLGLLLGSLGTLITSKPDRWQPLCGGILAAESLWIMGKILFS